MGEALEENSARTVHGAVSRRIVVMPTLDGAGSEPISTDNA